MNSHGNDQYSKGQRLVLRGGETDRIPLPDNRASTEPDLTKQSQSQIRTVAQVRFAIFVWRAWRIEAHRILPTSILAAAAEMRIAVPRNLMEKHRK